MGIGAGLITGAHLYVMSGFTGLAGGIAAPLTGLLAGGVTRFFLQERVFSPAKAIFIGIPMVLTNSISIAMAAMVHIYT